MSQTKIEENFKSYITAFNTHDIASYSKYYADDISIHLPAVPPTSNKTETIALFEKLTFIRETLHPTWILVGEGRLAMEAVARTEVLEDLPFPFPFTGKTYVKGERFEHPTIVHYEYNDEGLITTFRSFSQILTPDPGFGIVKEVLPGF